MGEITKKGIVKRGEGTTRGTRAWRAKSARTLSSTSSIFTSPVSSNRN